MQQLAVVEGEHRGIGLEHGGFERDAHVADEAQVPALLEVVARGERPIRPDVDVALGEFREAPLDEVGLPVDRHGLRLER